MTDFEVRPLQETDRRWAAQLLAEADIDGALVGGASLKSASFLGIISAAG